MSSPIQQSFKKDNERFLLRNVSLFSNYCTPYDLLFHPPFQQIELFNIFKFIFKLQMKISKEIKTNP